VSYFAAYPDSELDPCHPLKAEDKELFNEVGKELNFVNAGAVDA
jgi:hypothetical protein